MNKLGKLDLMGIATLGSVAAALLVGWTVSTHETHAALAHHDFAPTPVTLTDGGTMKLRVTGGHAPLVGAAHAGVRTASARPAGGPSLEVLLPYAFRP